MKNENRTLWDQKKEDRESYKKGLREGWDQAVWAFMGIGVVVYFIASYFPD